MTFRSSYSHFIILCGEKSTSLIISIPLHFSHSCLIPFSTVDMYSTNNIVRNRLEFLHNQLVNPEQSHPLPTTAIISTIQASSTSSIYLNMISSIWTSTQTQKLSLSPCL